MERSKRKKALIAAMIAITIIAVITLGRARISYRNAGMSESHKMIAQPTQGLDSRRSISRRLEQISLRNKSKQEGVSEYLRRREEDNSFDWRVPISFYGRVIDETLRPIEDATILFQWSDLSINGASEAKTKSDANGSFSFTNVHGKGLSVRVSKDGYYTTAASRGDFEFANPAEATYYEPSPDNPVVFQLRKRGEGADLIRKTVEVTLPGDGSPKAIDLAVGKIRLNGELRMQSFKPWPPRPMSPHYDWKVSLNISDGGFVEAHEEFPFEAPETVYEPTFEVNMPASLGDAWKVSAEKTLYFVYGNPKKYGRLNLRTDGNSRYIFIDYVLNPSGSRNLEEASAAVSNRP